MEGLIIKGIGGFYYVKTACGLFQAKGRGIFKKQGITLAVGDIVDLEVPKQGDGIINSIAPRKNHFIRPPISNIDTFVIVVSADSPKPNFPLIDKFLIMAEMNNVEAIICINKGDLVTEEELLKIEDIYSKMYKVIRVCAQENKGIPNLKEAIKGKRVAFAGPSGVGKSTITNLIIPHANMETGDISNKTRRGKHTTRHVEIFEGEDGSMVFDTPGFTSFDILKAEEEDLADYYIEFRKYANMCRFDNCRHMKEPDCAVREALLNEEISKTRYDSYIMNLEEIRNRKKY